MPGKMYLTLVTCLLAVVAPSSSSAAAASTTDKRKNEIIITPATVVDTTSSSTSTAHSEDIKNPNYWTFNACTGGQSNIEEISSKGTSSIDTETNPTRKNDTSNLDWAAVLELIMNSIEDLAGVLNIQPSTAAQLRKVLRVLISEKDTVLDVAHLTLDLFAVQFDLPPAQVESWKTMPFQETMQLFGAYVTQLEKFPNVYPAFVERLVDFEQAVEQYVRRTNPNDPLLEILNKISLKKFPMSELFQFLSKTMQQVQQLSTVDSTYLTTVQALITGLETFSNEMTPPLPPDHPSRQWMSGLKFMIGALEDILEINTNPTLPTVLRKLAAKFRGDESTLAWIKVTVGTWYAGVDRELLNRVTFGLDALANFLEFIGEGEGGSEGTPYTKFLKVTDELDNGFSNVVRELVQAGSKIKLTTDWNSTSFFLHSLGQVILAQVLDGIVTEPNGTSTMQRSGCRPNSTLITCAQTQTTLPACEFDPTIFVNEISTIISDDLSTLSKEKFDVLVSKTFLEAAKHLDHCSRGILDVAVDVIKQAGTAEVAKDFPSMMQIARGLALKIKHVATGADPRGFADKLVFNTLNYVFRVNVNSIVQVGKLVPAVDNLIQWYNVFVKVELTRTENFLKKLELAAETNERVAVLKFAQLCAEFMFWLESDGQYNIWYFWYLYWSALLLDAQPSAVVLEVQSVAVPEAAIVTQEACTLQSMMGGDGVVQRLVAASSAALDAMNRLPYERQPLTAIAELIISIGSTLGSYDELATAGIK